jgi:hypothetical protein
MGLLAARRPIPTPTTEVRVFLATNGWWPWLLLYAIIIGVIGAGLVYLLRRRRANKDNAVTASAAQVTPAAPPSDTPDAPKPTTPSEPDV